LGDWNCKIGFEDIGSEIKKIVEVKIRCEIIIE
jgi:hypothetical protein